MRIVSWKLGVRGNKLAAYMVENVRVLSQDSDTHPSVTVWPPSLPL